MAESGPFKWKAERQEYSQRIAVPDEQAALIEAKRVSPMEPMLATRLGKAKAMRPDHSSLCRAVVRVSLAQLDFNNVAQPEGMRNEVSHPRVFRPLRARGTINELALHAVMPQDWPLTSFEPFQERTEVELSQEIIERYIGTYEISPGNTVAITMDNGRLYWQIGSSPNFELAAESDSVFFDKANPSMLTIEFVGDDSGEVAALEYDYNGANGTAPRVNANSENEPSE